MRSLLAALLLLLASCRIQKTPYHKGATSYIVKDGFTHPILDQALVMTTEEGDKVKLILKWPKAGVRMEFLILSKVNSQSHAGGEEYAYLVTRLEDDMTLMLFTVVKDDQLQGLLLTDGQGGKLVVNILQFCYT